MNIKKNKTLTLLHLMLSIIIFAFFIYKTTISINKYSHKEHILNYVLLIEHINYILNKVEKEKIYSSIYIGKEKKVIINQLQSSRKAVEQEIKQTLMFLKKNSFPLNQKKIFSDIFNDLIQIRHNIDLNTNDQTVQKYEKIIKQLNETMRIHTNVLPSDYKNKIAIFSSLMHIKNQLNKETAFIAFILSTSKKMTSSELLFWDKLIKNDVYPDFQHLHNSTMLKEMYKIITPINFSNIKSHERAEIFNHTTKGNYHLPIEKWLNVSSSKVDKINLVQNILFIDTKSKLSKEIELTKEKTTLLIITSIFFFLLILMLLYLNYNIRKNSKYLTDTLKDIEKDLNEKQKLEIQEVIKKNDTIEIYKFLANAIKEPSKEKDNFLANMSHEIRTPLNGIIGFTNLLKAEQLNETALEFVNIIDESSKNLLYIVNDILDFAKISSGKIELEEIPFNIMEKFEATIDSYAIEASQKNIDLTLLIDPNLPSQVIGDPTRIAQVLLNLLSNAIKFTPDNGQIAISIKQISQNHKEVEVEFSVKDSGIGIAEEQQVKIFDAFSQADATTNRKFGGTGLGLSISSKFVELMGGRLEIKSKPQQGSKFFFTLKLKHSSSDKKTIQANYSQLTIGYIQARTSLDTNIKKNTRIYIENLGATFHEYNGNGLFSNKSLPDILFIDECYINSELLKRYLRLETKIVFICNSHTTMLDNIPKNKISKVIHKPLNFSKTLQTLEKLKTSNHSRTAKKRILLYKDTKVSGRVYEAILNNLDYQVDIAHSEEEFKKQISIQSYAFAIFDSKALFSPNNKRKEDKMIKLIKENGTMPLTFSDPQELKEFLKQA